MNVVKINFTNGVGNNMFQYIYARMVAQAQGMELWNPALPALGVKENIAKYPHMNVIQIKGSSKAPFDYHSLLCRMTGANLNLKVYPEDFRLYVDKQEEIKSWFALPGDWGIPKDDLVLHLRLGDRLVMRSTYDEKNYISPEAFILGISSFDFDRLHIVTDMPVWRRITKEEVKTFLFHRPVKGKDRIDPEVSVQYFNDLYDKLMEFDPIVRCGKMVEDDFSYMRSANKLMLAHGTLAWMAGFLGVAEEVSVYSKWRGGKDINLAWTPTPGWRQWGPKTAPQHEVKQWHLKRLAKKHNLKVFVETGTRGGMMLRKLQSQFDYMCSVEIVPEAFKKLAVRLKDMRNLRLYLGNSAELLPEMLKPVKKRNALFWLDAHDGRNSCPVLEELKHILPTKQKHVIVIDDLRYFGTEKMYPTVGQVVELVRTLQPNAEIYFKFDSIRIFL